MRTESARDDSDELLIDPSQLPMTSQKLHSACGRSFVRSPQNQRFFGAAATILIRHRPSTLARSGHIHLSTFAPEKPTRRDVILTTTRQGRHAVVPCMSAHRSDTPAFRRRSEPTWAVLVEPLSPGGYPITITEFDMNSNDDDFQAGYMCDFMTAVFSNPHTAGLVQWGFWAGSHYFPSAGLWNKDWSLRKHGQAFVDMVTKTWRTDADGRTAADGAYATRGFYGDYDVTITHAGKTKTVRLKLAPGTAVQTITVPL